MSQRTELTRHLFRFHWRSGARVALRANGVIAGAVLFVFALDMNALAHLRIALLQLVARGFGSEARSELAAISVVLAALAMPRITLGATGWMRSLPISRSASRRAALMALCSVQVFTIAVDMIAMIADTTVYGANLDIAKIVSLPLIYIAAAVIVLPVESSAGRVLGVLAIGLAVPGQWALDIGAVVALLVADPISGAMVPFRKSHRTETRMSVGAGPIAQWIGFTLRTLPRATLAACLVLPAMFTILSGLIVLHNPDLDRTAIMRTVLIGGMLSLMTFAASLANSIVRARPAWPWARSLPWSSRERAVGDAILLAATMSLFPLYFAFVDWRPALVLALTIPPLAASAAAGIRVGANRQVGAAGEIVALSVVVGIAITLLPWTAVIFLATTPLLLALAARRERRLVSTQW
ncbi:MAG TPA: hypothetical protein VGN65_10435, partial [Casimicrobiaceae bacterium]